MIQVHELIENKVIRTRDDIKGLIYLATVQGTPPKNADLYKFKIELLDSEGVVYYMRANKEDGEFSVCPEEGLPNQIH